MINNALIFSLLIIVLSCSESKKDDKIEVIKQTVAKKDSIKNQTIVQKDTINPIQLSVFNKIDTLFSLPFSIDSIFIDIVQTNNYKIDTSTLSTDEVIFLTTSLKDDLPNSNLDIYLKDFYKLDSLIKENKYDEYIEQIDIGMMMYCNAYITGELNLSDTTKIVLWSLSFSTYEACPFSYGTIILGTLFYKNNLTNTIQLGEATGGGDAPIYWETLVYSSIENQQIKTQYTSYVAEMVDENNNDYIEYKDTTYQIKITNNGFQF